MSALALLQAPAGWRAIEFISDLHLGLCTPRTTAAWASYLRQTDADAVFLLGDVFEVWIGDDAADSSGFEADAAAVLADSARQRWTGFMAGNRDFLLGDELLARCGVHRLTDPTRLNAWGHAVLLSHGDLLCLADTDYQRFRAEVRSSAWQQRFLAQPLAERAAQARAMRDASEQLKRGASSAEWADVDDAAAAQWLRESGCSMLIHGHTHRPGSTALGDGLQRHVLSDWDLDEALRAPMDHDGALRAPVDHDCALRAQVLRLTPDGTLQRRAPP